MPSVWVSVDVEPDISEYPVESQRGLREALPPLLDLFHDLHVPVDFFVLGQVALESPEVVRTIASQGHEVGSHSHSHGLLCGKSLQFQRDTIRRSTQIVSSLTKKPVRIFRAPNFGADGTTIRALEELGIPFDSSVMPGRSLRKWRLLRAYDHRSAPRGPYTPSTSDIDSPGAGSVLELPMTENPVQLGTPIGLGFLNSHSVEETVKALPASTCQYVSFLIHPWEAVDLATNRRDLPPWLSKACRSDLSPLREFLTEVGETNGLSTARSIASIARPAR